MEPCPICDQPIRYSQIGSRDAYSVKCPRCGQYCITRTALANLRNSSLSSRQRANFSGWLVENQNFEITISNLDGLLNIKTPSFHERADKFLLNLERRTEYAGQSIRKDLSWISRAWCTNEDELAEILSFLESSRRVTSHDHKGDIFFKVIPDGWAHLEKIKEANPDSPQGFVAMWFDDAMQSVYQEVISKGILDAGYKPHRVDQREHNNKIDDEIIAEIRRSRFVVADFTGHRGGVYYEAGFAKGLGLEVIWTCRKDDIDNLHFDIRQYNCIDWEQGKLSDFRKRLSYRIERVLGRGTYQP